MNSLKISKQQFERMLQLEGRKVIADNIEYKILVRPISSKTSQESIMIIYAQDDYALGKGSIFEMNGEHFLIVNRRSWDSEYFYTSTAIRCNAHWRVNGQDYYLVCGDLSSPNPGHGSRISEVNGNISMYTGLSYMTYLDTCFYVCGGTYKCVNKFDIDGLTYYYFQRELNIPSVNYANVEINNRNSLQFSSVGGTYQLHNEIKAIYGTNNAHYYIPDSFSDYISTNENVATVDKNGLVTAIGEGTCTIISTMSAMFNSNNDLHPFTKQTFTCNISVTVGGGSPTPDPDPPTPPEPTPTGYATVTCSSSTWYVGNSRTFVGHVFDDYNVEQPAQSGTWSFSWDKPYNIYDYLTVETTAVNKVKGTLSSSAPTQAIITVQYAPNGITPGSTTIRTAIM